MSGVPYDFCPAPPDFEMARELSDTAALLPSVCCPFLGVAARIAQKFPTYDTTRTMRMSQKHLKKYFPSRYMEKTLSRL